MSNKKKMFSGLATLTAGAIAGTALALSPVVAFANDDHHGEKACKGEKHECKCAGDKKAECEKDHHDKGEKSCGGEGKCSGGKH